MVSANLLQITTQPTVLDISTVNGQLVNPKAPDPLIEHSVSPGGFKINTRDAVLEVDSYPARASMGIYNDMDMLRNQTQKGQQVAAEATREAVQEGDALLDKVTPAQMALQKEKEKSNVQTTTVFMPSKPAEVHFERGGVDLNYTPFKANIDWNNLQIEGMNFQKGSVDVSVAQKAYIDIQYMGEPTYFPSDANPNIKFNTSV